MQELTDLTVYCLLRDRSEVLTAVKSHGAFLTNELGSQAGTLMLKFDCRTTALDRVLDALTERKLPYHGNYSGGNSCPRGHFCRDGRSFVRCSTAISHYGPIVPLYADGSVNARQREEGLRYWRVLTRAQTRIRNATLEPCAKAKPTKRKGRNRE